MSYYFFQAEDGIRVCWLWLEFRRVLFRSVASKTQAPKIVREFGTTSLNLRHRGVFTFDDHMQVNMHTTSLHSNYPHHYVESGHGPTGSMHIVFNNNIFYKRVIFMWHPPHPNSGSTPALQTKIKVHTKSHHSSFQESRGCVRWIIVLSYVLQNHLPAQAQGYYAVAHIHCLPCVTP